MFLEEKQVLIQEKGVMTNEMALRVVHMNLITELWCSSLPLVVCTKTIRQLVVGSFLCRTPTSHDKL